MAEARRELTVFDRSMIEVRPRDGLGIRAIARDLGRSAGMISDEVNRHGGVGAYHAPVAAAQADANRRVTGRRPRLAQDGVLFGQVAALLRLGWSPEQMSGRRKRVEAGGERRCADGPMGRSSTGFDPRPRAGSDEPADDGYPADLRFDPRPRAGSDIGAEHGIAVEPAVSIRAPVRGATCSSGL